MSEDTASVLEELELTPALIIGPGDVLVVACSSPLSAAETEMVRGSLALRMPGLGDVVVLAAPLTLAAVYRKAGPAHE